MDLLDAAALSGAVEDREIEEIHPIENPLDILAQILLALCLEEPRNVDALFALIRTFPPFHALGRPAYDGVIELLAGRYDASRLRDLKPRLYFDRAAGTLTCADGVLAQLYSSGGAIPDRGYYSMRLEDGAKIGELDEEFVWERRAGDTFSFGSRAWKILSISPESVQVVPLDRPADFMPFWRAEARNRSSILARRTLEFLSAVQNGGDAHALAQRLPFTEAAGASLAHFLEAQQHAQGRVSLSGPSFTAIEICADPSRHGESLSVLIHTLRGGGVNHPLALALGAELEERLGMRIETIADDEGVLLIMPLVGIENPETLLRAALFRLGSRDSRDRLLKERLEGSGIFGAAFREAAERSLLLPRGGFGKRMPLWITRRRAKRLFDEVSGYGDFPVVVEAYRSCLADFFDMPSFNEYCDSLGSGALGLGFFHTRSPSPFARNALWRETNRFLYEGDDAPARSGGSASDQAIQGALGEARLRPVLKAETILAFQSRLRRELPGWAPEDALSLAEWVKERVGIPEDEWERLVALAGPDLRESLDSDPGLEGRILRYTCPGATSPILIHRERHEAWTNDPLSLLGEWLRCEGPLHTDRILEVFGGPKAELEDALDALVDAGTLVRDVEAEGPIGGSAIPGAEPEGKPLPAMGGLFCDRENLELLLRLQRRSARPQVRERPVSLLVPFLARRQGLGQGAALPWESLSGFAAPVSLWETELFPARFPAYRPELLDGAIAEGNLLWYGAGKGKVSLCPLEDFDLVGDVDGPSAQSRASLPSTAPAGLVGAAPAAVDSPFGDADRPRDFWELRDALVASMGTYSGAGETISALRLCEKRLWDEVWAGRMSSDTWESLRRGLETDFGEKEDPAAAAHAAGSAISSSVGGNVRPSTRPSSRSLPRSLPRALRNRWRSGPPVAGLWFSLGADPGARSGAASGAATAAWEAQDWALEQEEIDRDRIRLLIRRWGLLCRPILEREGGPLSWSRLLPAMRRLELAGELIAGRFFSGLPGPQFANPQIAQDLDACEAEKGAYWMNALDPASPAGLSADGLDPNLPARIGTARLSYLGSRLAAVSLRNGKDLRVFLPPGDPQLQQALAFLTVPRKRTVRPERKVVVETIQGVAAASSAGAVSATTAGAGDSGVAGAGDAAIAGAGDAVAAPARSSAASSPYAPVLRTLGFEADRGRMVLW
jgi:ATP-dependent Lhr-like helicase